MAEIRVTMSIEDDAPFWWAEAIVHGRSFTANAGSGMDPQAAVAMLAGELANYIEAHEGTQTPEPSDNESKDADLG